MTLIALDALDLTEAELRVAIALRDLAIARGGEMDGDQYAVYLRALADQTPALVERACAEIGIEPRGAFESVVPPVGQIRARVAELARRDRETDASRRLLPMPADARPDREPTFFCLDCLDEPSGWRLWWCPGRGVRRTFERREDDVTPMAECARGAEHAPHAYAARCACVDTNPVIARHRQRLAEARHRRERGAA